MKDLIKFAHNNPSCRKEIVPLIRKFSSSCKRITGGDRKNYEQQVWDMFVLTYSKIGLILSSPAQLYKYPVWDICFQGANPVSFNLYKKTPFGLKFGLAGSDGSSEGKKSIVNNIRTKFKIPGIYGEISHKVEDIALGAGAPVVCAYYVPEILGKPISETEDQIHYKRNLPQVGSVKKIMVGNPIGIPTTDSKHPSCPTSDFFPPPASMRQGGIEEADHFHYFCLLF